MMWQHVSLVSSLWFFGLAKMGYGGGEVLTLGPCKVENRREGMNNGEKMGGGGGGKEVTWQQFVQFLHLGGHRPPDQK